MGFGIEQNGSCDTSYKSLLGNTNIDKTFGSGNEKDNFKLYSAIKQPKVVEEGSRLDRLYKRKTEKLQEIK